ncbi:MAG: hypothetical protein ABI144_09750 [Gallionella sp.]
METNTDQPNVTEVNTEVKTGAKPNAKDDLKSLPLEEVEKNWSRRQKVKP